MSVRRFGCVLTLTIVCALSATANAQPIGTFRWQQQPYCNVLTVNVVQTGTIYQLDGVDDQCGATTRASVAGLAFLNPNGTIGIGLTIVTTPGATPLHLDATLNWPSVSGTWRDSAGATGPFVFTPGAPAAGSARPIPTPSFPAGLTVGGGAITNVGAPVAATDAANKAYVDAGTASVRSALVSAKAWSAYVLSGGSKARPGRYTSSRTAAGTYSVSFDLTGVGAQPAFGFPPVTVSLIGGGTCLGGSVQVTGGAATFGGGALNNVSLVVATFNSAGAATDCAFFLVMHPGDTDAPASPVPPLATEPADSMCTTAGEVTTCVIGGRD